VASDLTIPAHGGLPVFSTLRTPPEKSTPPKEGYLPHLPPERLQKEARSQRLRIIPVTFIHPPARHSSRLGQRLQGAIGAAAALAAISLSPGSAQAYVVTVNSVQYDVTTFTGSYDDNTSKFETAANNGVMPWWGSESLASQFNVAVGGNLGLPNTYFGPFFGWSFGGGRVSLETYFGMVDETLSGTVPQNQSGTWARATSITPPAGPPPAPCRCSVPLPPSASAAS
jgi:hypothetical protein